MKKRHLLISAAFLAAFALWTLAVCRVDVRPIGPESSAVGFAGLNRFVHQLTGVHWGLYALTDWLGLIPLAVAFGFGLLGLCQWIRRGRLRLVDADLLLLGGFYLAVLMAFGLFEVVPINFRPVLVDGVLEASYPSSTTLLTMCVMPTAAMQLRSRIRNHIFRRWVTFAIGAFTVFMVAGRLLSGVHWVTDIIGGALLSAGLVTLYASLTKIL